VTNSLKQRVIEALQKAQQEERLRAERIREIIQNAVVAAVAEVKEGSTELSFLVQEASAAALEFLQEKEEAIPENISAALEGVIRGVTNFKRESIAQTQNQIQELQQKVEAEEETLETEITTSLNNIKKNYQSFPANLKTAIDNAIEGIQKREEMALLQKHYAQLKVQLAILQANLAERYGNKSEEINRYLEEAKAWYDKAKENPELFSGTIQEKHDEFAKKLGTVGAAIAKKEKQAQQLLQELWGSVTELFAQKGTPN
jgi:hypothetical protein